MPDHPDPFVEARCTGAVLNTCFNGEQIPFILGLKDVRKAAKDWRSFSSDHPYKVVPHTEENLRSVRQLPIETDPPDHTDYRKLVEPLFRKPTQAWYQEEIKALIDGMVTEAVAAKEVEAVYEFALPLQCRALTRLLGVAESEAEEWIGWGLHVFNDGDGQTMGKRLESYILDKLEQAEQNPGDDFFSILHQVELRGRKLTAEEKRGFANLAFAGGRDTIINVVSSIWAYLGEHPEALEFLRVDPMRIITATEEFVRYVSPLTAIARTCPHGASAGGVEVQAGSRVGLCWPSANRDAQIFQSPDEVVLDRKPNPHVGFGFGPHSCLGAPHARLIIRSLLQALCEQVSRVELLACEPKIETEESYVRQVGYESVTIRLTSRM